MERGIFETNEQVHIMYWVGISAIKKNREKGDTEYWQDAILYWMIKKDLID